MTTRNAFSDTSRSCSAGERAAVESGQSAVSPLQSEPGIGDAGTAARDGRVLVFGQPAPGETGWLIRDMVDRQALIDAVGECLDLLETSAAVHEKNGECVLAIFASDWCRLLSGAAQDRSPAVADCPSAGERRVCRESGWRTAARVASETGQPTDIACDGGIRVYAVPIRAGGETVGTLSFGHDVPPRDAARLEELAARYLVPLETLRQHAEAYEPHPPTIVELAKRRLNVSARLLGEIIGRRRAERKLQAANRMLRMITACNQSMMRTASEAVLLEATCRHIAERGGYPLAWVGWADASSSGGPLQLAAHVGGDAAFLEAAWTQCCSLAQGRGLAGAALRTGRPAVVADLTDASVAPACRQHAMQNGYASAIALPLLSEGRALGVLMIHAAVPDAFHAEEVDLLTELANDLAYGVVAVRTRANRDRAEAAIDKEELEDLLRQAQKLEAVGRLARGVAHDFNNGLSVIQGYGELALEEAPPDTPLRRYLQEILATAQRSVGIARQLAAFARRQVISPKTLDLNESIEGALGMLRRLLGEDIDLAWRPGAGLGPVLVDPSQLDQILTSLCIGARDAIADVGRISIQTENDVLDEAACAGSAEAVPGEYAVLAVSDNGCGMTPDILDQIYEPFFTTKGLGNGTGLGSPTVYGIAKQNRGFVRVSSEAGRGTTFQIYLPRQSHSFEAGPADQSPAVPRGRGETVLVVEDDLRILDLVETALTHLGYLVLSAATPGDALRLAQQFGSRIDLLVSDIVMPEMNGRELAERLGAMRPQLKRLFISGYTADVIAERGVLEAGVHLLYKPFSSRELAARIRAVLDE